MHVEKTIWQYMDVYPKVVAAGKPTQITVCPLMKRGAFAGHRVELFIRPIQQREYPLDDTPRGQVRLSVEPDADGCLRFTHAFAGEQEHFIQIGVDGEWRDQVSVYSVEGDLAGLIPLYGDQHVHTNHSDGWEDPGFVAGEYRMRGYDYIAITDHHTMSGSLEAISVFEDVPLGFHLMVGEEVHLPDCPLHVVHIGGRWSVNARVDANMRLLDKKNPGMREKYPFAWGAGANPDFPGTLSDEAFRKAVWDYAGTLSPLPEGLPRFTYAGFSWICREIRRAGGLSIFVHPYWIEDLFHADERLTEYILRTRPFDAYEVLGGERYFEQNGFQTAQYHDMRAQGCDFPIVGSSDCHHCYKNPIANVAATITFARANETPAILDAIRAGYTVAVDGVSQEPRLVGKYRLVKYAQFLMEHYFPLHREACFEEGRAMKAYAAGEREEAAAQLRSMKDRTRRLWEKYFAF